MESLLNSSFLNIKTYFCVPFATTKSTTLHEYS
jgi:hypothetical protein